MSPINRPNRIATRTPKKHLPTISKRAALKKALPKQLNIALARLARFRPIRRISSRQATARSLPRVSIWSHSGSLVGIQGLFSCWAKFGRCPPPESSEPAISFDAALVWSFLSPKLIQ